jgi:hypothetical protein
MFLKLMLQRSLIDWTNSLDETDLIKMGMNEWFIPQISEHCPENSPSRLDEMKV